MNKQSFLLISVAVATAAPVTIIALDAGVPANISKLFEIHPCLLHLYLAHFPE